MMEPCANPVFHAASLSRRLNMEDGEKVFVEHLTAVIRIKEINDLAGLLWRHPNVALLEHGEDRALVDLSSVARRRVMFVEMLADRAVIGTDFVPDRVDGKVLASARLRLRASR